MKTKDIIVELKSNNEDYEFYPTTKEMIQVIYDDIKSYVRFYKTMDFLDIGCGKCDFKKWFNYFGKEDNLAINKYFVIEKSRTLLNLLSKDDFIVGTDFNQTTLIDKKVQYIFCNPPYSEFEEWTKRIIKEANSEHIYLVIPERWKENKDIMKLFNENVRYIILGNFDFLNAERQARAKVDIVKINKYFTTPNETFNEWFDETFPMRKIAEKDYRYDEQKELKNKIVSSENWVEQILTLYQDELDKLCNHFKAITNLDAEILESIGVRKRSVCESLRLKLEGLKHIYWGVVFDKFDKITERLTQESRKKLLDKFTGQNNVDFTFDNIYSILIWVIKNSSDYFNTQLVDIFKLLSSYDNVIKYKSNQNTFSQEKWRWGKSETHYLLDYRIVCSSFCFTNGWNNGLNKYAVRNIINDFMVIARNLGFESKYNNEDEGFGKPRYIKMLNGETLFEYKLYRNGNMHIKFNLEFSKAFNVEASRLLGWIKSKEDIKNEFCDSMKGAEKYFNSNINIGIETAKQILIGDK